MNDEELKELEVVLLNFITLEKLSKLRFVVYTLYICLPIPHVALY